MRTDAEASQSRVLTIIFGRKREEATGGWAELYSQGLNDLFYSHDIFKVMKLWKIRWVDYVASIGEKKLTKELAGGENLEGHYLDDRE